MKIRSLISRIVRVLSGDRRIIYSAFFLAVAASCVSYLHGYVVAYGDAESHLNIAKRVIHSPTAGLAQLGGVWLPLPHLIMVPLVYFDGLWRSGIAGAVVSGISYVVSAYFIFRLALLITGNRQASVIAFLVFALNPNILYMQSTPMTELPLLAFFITSIYFFVRFMLNTAEIYSLVFAGLSGFAATLTRYDGWFLVLIEAAIILYLWIVKPLFRRTADGTFVLFITPALLGIGLWFIWGYMILGDPLYFSNSPFSANSQQQGWLARGELPAYHNLISSFQYYFATSGINVGWVLFSIGILGIVFFIFHKNYLLNIPVTILLLTPFIFYVVTLYIGQSVIFLPGLTPRTFEWNLFNVRYGIMMVPVIAFFIGYVASMRKNFYIVAMLAIGIQSFYFVSGVTPVITLEDGVRGLSRVKIPHAQQWLTDEYDGGWVLMDDYARTISIIRSGIPMQNVIYIGNKPYWNESLEEPEKYVRWIVIQKDDSLWANFMNNKEKADRLYKYFNKVYTSPEIVIFRKMTGITASSAP